MLNMPALGAIRVSASPHIRVMLSVVEAFGDNQL